MYCGIAMKKSFESIPIGRYEFLYLMVKNVQIRSNEIVSYQQKTYSYVRIRYFYRTKYTNSYKWNHISLVYELLCTNSFIWWEKIYQFI